MFIKFLTGLGVWKILMYLFLLIQILLDYFLWSVTLTFILHTLLKSKTVALFLLFMCWIRNFNRFLMTNFSSKKLLLFLFHLTSPKFPAVSRGCNSSTIDKVWTSTEILIIQSVAQMYFVEILSFLPFYSLIYFKILSRYGFKICFKLVKK